MDAAERKGWLASAFKERVGGHPTVWVRAPGRVDLMGSHTDYNMGFVLTLAIDRDTWIAARPRSDRRVSIRSLNVEGETTFSLDSIHHDTVFPWTDYIRGVAHVLQDEGYVLDGFDGLIHSTNPIGGGLSSSAALEVAVALVFMQLGSLEIEPVRLALLCQRAENQFVGMSCGILDQFSSVMGQAGCTLLLDCRDLIGRPIPLAAGLAIVICDTRAKRELTGSGYRDRRNQCELGAAIMTKAYPRVKALRDVTLEQLEARRQDLSEVVYRRCRFIVEENRRVLDLSGALSAGNRAEIGALADASLEGARDMFEIGWPEMDAMSAAIHQAPGFIGGRPAGAGFGGCLVVVVEQKEVDAFVEEVSIVYERSTGLRPDIYPVQASAGAGLL